MPPNISSPETTTALHFKNVRLLDPENSIDQLSDLYVFQRKLSYNKTENVKYQTIEGTGLWLSPAFIDLSHHFKATRAHRKSSNPISKNTELQAASANGFIQVVCPPTTTPINDTAAVTNWLKESTQPTSANTSTNQPDNKSVTLLPLGALTNNLDGKQLSDMFALKAAGCVGVSNAGIAVQNNLVRLRCFEYAACADLTIFSRPEDTTLSAEGCAHDGIIAEKLGLKTIPGCSEAIAVARDLLLSEETGCRIHFTKLSSQISLKLIASAANRNQRVSCDVAAANLLFTDAKIEDFDSTFHVTPPLRSEADRKALISGLKAGLIQAICSDHQALDSATKLAPFADSSPGMATLDGLLANLLKLVDSQELTPLELLGALSSGPAHCLSKPAFTLQEGAAANLTLIDPNATWELTRSTQISSGCNSPFIDKTQKGKTLLTIKDGDIIYQESELLFSKE